MYQLHYHPGTASFVVHWLLIEMDLPHETKYVDFSQNEQKSAGYLKINPSGLVPTLIIEEQPVSEFAAISMYLADAHLEKGLAPNFNDPNRAIYNQWMFYISNTIQPAFRLWFYPQDLGEEKIIKPIIKEKIESYFERINQNFNDRRPYLIGDQMTTADFLLTMIMRWSRNMEHPADSWNNLNKFAQRMKALPSFRETYRREGLTDWL